MNRITKYTFGLIAVIALFLAIGIPALTLQVSAEEKAPRIKQTACTETKVTVKWESQQGIDKDNPDLYRKMEHYTLETMSMVTEWKDPKWAEDGRYCITIPEDGSETYERTLTLPANHWGVVKVSLTYLEYEKIDETMDDETKDQEYTDIITEDGVEYGCIGKVTESPELACHVTTKPKRPTKSQFGLADTTTVNKLTIKSWIEVKAPKWYYKRQVELYKGNKKLKTFDLSYVYDADFKLSKGASYQYRVRYYIENGTTHVKHYSDWSPWRGFMIPRNLGFGSSPSAKGFKIILEKIDGITKYTVYTSLKKTYGFKKAKTFAAKNKKKYTVKIKKGYKKKKKNYIKLAPYISLKYYKGYSDFSIVTPRALKIYK